MGFPNQQISWPVPLTVRISSACYLTSQAMETKLYKPLRHLVVCMLGKEAL